MKIKQLTPTEHEEAVILASYLELLQYQGKIMLYSHLPTETFTKNWGTRMKNKTEGVRQGVPDYIIVMKDKVLFIELKRVKGSITSLEQRQWLVNLGSKTTEATVAYGFDDAKKFIESYI